MIYTKLFVTFNKSFTYAKNSPKNLKFKSFQKIYILKRVKLDRIRIHYEYLCIQKLQSSNQKFYTQKKVSLIQTKLL